MSRCLEREASGSPTERVRLCGETLASGPLGGRATGGLLFNPNVSWHMFLSSLVSRDDCGCENVNFARVSERSLQSERGHTQEHDPIGRLGWMCVFFCFYRGEGGVGGGGYLET